MFSLAIPSRRIGRVQVHCFEMQSHPANGYQKARQERQMKRVSSSVSVHSHEQLKPGP